MRALDAGRVIPARRTYFLFPARAAFTGDASPTVANESPLV